MVCGPGELWAGTLPGGLFRSRDRGDSWELVRSLWDVPQRKEWMGGGDDVPGIHSICVDPRADDGGTLAMGSTIGGVWLFENGGESWQAVSTTCRRCMRCVSAERTETGWRHRGGIG